LSFSFFVSLLPDIELGDGHYWLKENLTISHPIRIVGDENNPSNVVVEVEGSILWTSLWGWCEGVTFRRPKLMSADSTEKPIIILDKGGTLDVVNSVFDNSGGHGPAIVDTGSKPRRCWTNVLVRDNVISNEEAMITLSLADS
jgi:hypothetical protein